MKTEPLSPGAPLLAEARSQDLSLPEAGAWLWPAVASEMWPQAALALRWQMACFLRWPERSLQTRGAVETRQATLPIAAWWRAAGPAAGAAAPAEADMPVPVARLFFRSRGGQLMLDEAMVMAQDLHLRARGAVSAGQGWQLSTRLYARETGLGLLGQLTDRWPADRRLPFTKLPDSPWVFLDVPVQGPLAAPAAGMWGQLWTWPALRAELDRLRRLPEA